MRSSAIVGALVLCVVSIGAGAAEPPVFTSSGANCTDITWQPDVLVKYPNVAKACQAVVERSGKTYVMFKGKVQRRAGARGLYIRFEGGDRAILVNPPADMVAHIGNETLRVRDSLPGQELTVFMPSDRFVASFGDETDVVIAEAVPVADVEALPDEAPPAATAPAPAAATPAPMAAAAPAPVAVPTPVPPQSNEKFFLIVVGIALVIIVLAIITMRRRS